MPVVAAEPFPGELGWEPGALVGVGIYIYSLLALIRSSTGCREAGIGSGKGWDTDPARMLETHLGFLGTLDWTPPATVTPFQMPFLGRNFPSHPS